MFLSMISTVYTFDLCDQHLQKKKKEINFIEEILISSRCFLLLCRVISSCWNENKSVVSD